MQQPESSQHREGPPVPPTRVSVVITTYTIQRWNDTRDLLRALHAQTYREMEVIFVAEGSPELRELGQRLAVDEGMTNLRVIAKEDGVRGLSPARNLGLSHATGEIVAFTDDHALPERDWIAEIVATFAQHPEAIGVTGQAFPLWEDRTMSWFPEEFYWVLSCTSWKSGDRTLPVRNPWGVNMAFRKEVFALCTFSDDFGVSNRGTASGVKLGLSGDDTDFGVRATRATGRPILFNPRLHVMNKVGKHKLTPYFIRRRAFWDGYTKAVLGRIHSAGSGGKTFNLSSEATVLRRIAFPFLPRTILQLVLKPRVAARRLVLAVDVVTHVFLGYASGRVPNRWAFIARRYSR